MRARIPHFQHHNLQRSICIQQCMRKHCAHYPRHKDHNASTCKYSGTQGHGGGRKLKDMSVVVAVMIRPGQTYASRTCFFHHDSVVFNLNPVSYSYFALKITRLFTKVCIIGRTGLGVIDVEQEQMLPVVPSLRIHISVSIF